MEVGGGEGWCALDCGELAAVAESCFCAVGVVEDVAVAGVVDDFGCAECGGVEVGFVAKDIITETLANDYSESKTE